MTYPKRFKDFSDAEKGALLLAHHEGKRIETLADGVVWWKGEPTFHPLGIYRIAPDPLTPDSINWDHVSPEWNFMARDEDGRPFFYRSKPITTAISWVGDDNIYAGARALASYRRGTVDWKDSLVIRPGYREGS